MASIHPFRALRPAPDAAAAVSSVPYDVVSTDEARELAVGNPLSFLHVTRSEIDLPAGTDPYSPQVYDKARENLAALRDRAPLVIEEAPSLYFYRLRMGAHEQTGIAGCFSVDEYEPDVIKKHERTRRDKEDDRTRHIIELRAQTGVVFLTYKADAGDRRGSRAQVTAGAPLYDFTADDGVHHTIWRAGPSRPPSWWTRSRGSRRSTSPTGIIARRARRARAPRSRSRRGDPEEADTFIAVAFPDNQMQILPYNRTVKDLAGRTPEQFLAALRERFTVTDGAPEPRPQGRGVDVSRRALVCDRSRPASPRRRLAREQPRRRAPAAQRARADPRRSATCAPTSGSISSAARAEPGARSGRRLRQGRRSRSRCSR